MALVGRGRHHEPRYTTSASPLPLQDTSKSETRNSPSFNLPTLTNRSLELLERIVDQAQVLHSCYDNT
jgi:hypothetical protein